MEWYVYIVVCADGSFYTGIAKSVEERVTRHNNGNGSKYCRSRLPVYLTAKRGPMTHSEALKLEKKVKKQSKEDKIKTLNPCKKCSGRGDYFIMHPLRKHVPMQRIPCDYCQPMLSRSLTSGLPHSGPPCPNCSCPMEEFKCKLICTTPGCGYRVTCSE